MGREFLGLLSHVDPCPLRCFRSIKLEHQGYPHGWRSLGTSSPLYRCPQLLLWGLLGPISCHGGGCSLGHCPSDARARSWLESHLLFQPLGKEGGLKSYCLKSRHEASRQSQNPTIHVISSNLPVFSWPPDFFQHRLASTLLR